MTEENGSLRPEETPQLPEDEQGPVPRTAGEDDTAELDDDRDEPIEDSEDNG